MPSFATSDAVKYLVSGGIAGMAAKTTIAPLERLKILLQAQSKHYSHLGVFSGLKAIVAKEGVTGLFSGNGAHMLRVFPYGATKFASFEFYKRLFGNQSHVDRFAAGSLAGITGITLTFPLDTVRARLSFQVKGERIYYNGILDCVLKIFKNEGGIMAFYRGYVPAIYTVIPYSGFSFYCFETLKEFCAKQFPDLTCSYNSGNGGPTLTTTWILLCGGVAGAVAQTISYPLDVTRRRMQLAMMDEQTRKFGLGMIPTVKLIYHESGVIRGLYRGMSLNYLRAIPMVAVTYTSYEILKQKFKIEGSTKIKFD